MEKPTKNYVNFYRTEGNYNWLNSNDRSAQYVFSFPHLEWEEVKELGIKTSFLVDIEKDYDYNPEYYTALECLKEIQSIYEDYWMHSGKEEVRKTIAYLESIEEEQEQLRHQYEVDYAKFQIEFWTNKFNELQQ